MQLYVKAQSKAALNRHFSAGLTVHGVEYKMGYTDTVHSSQWPDGAIVKVYKALSPSGTPIAHAYGTVRRKGDVLTIA